MKYRIAIFATILALIAGMEGCKPSTPPVPAKPVPSNPAPPVVPQATTTAAAQTSLLPPTYPPATTVPSQAENTSANASSEFAAKKTDFIRASRGQLDAVNSEINSIDAKVINLVKDNAGKATAQQKISVLRAQSQNLKTELNNATDITEATWDDFKIRTEKTYADLKQSTTDTSLWLSDFLTRTPFDQPSSLPK